MNAFIVQNRDSFKRFVDEVCHVPDPIPSTSFATLPSTAPAYGPEVVSVERHMSYATPTTIMQRLPPSSREGFPSLPYLIDQARSYSELIQLWLESIETLSRPSDTVSVPSRSHKDVLRTIAAIDGNLEQFHDLCENLNTRTQECLARAERAERPESAPSFHLEDIIDQLRNTQITSNRDLIEILADKIANDPSILPEEANPAIAATIAQLRGQLDDTTDDEQQTRPYGPTPPRSGATSTFDLPRYADRSNHSTRPSSGNAAAGFHAGHSSVSLASTPAAPPPQRPYPLVKSSTSPGHSASASVSNLSSTVSSDTEHAPTALPSYEREIRHRERREAARTAIQQQVEAARIRERDKEKKKIAKLVPGLRKKRDAAAAAAATTNDDGSNGLWPAC